MAAPEYLIKLKFGTEVDKKAFADIENAYKNLSAKQQAAFAKQYNTTVGEMNQFFQKNTNANLKAYEQAAVKTEQTITKARVKELRQYIDKRNEQMKRLPGYAGGAAGAAGLLIANSAINNSFGMTSFEKNTATGALNAGAAGVGTGFFVAGPLGAVIGGAVGTATGLIMAEIENSADAIKRSSELFNQAVQSYTATVEAGRGLKMGAEGMGFASAGQYAVFQQAMKLAGIENLEFMYDLTRSIAAQKGLEDFGQGLITARKDIALNALYERYQNSGLTPEAFVMNPVAQGGLNQSDQRAGALIRLFKAGGVQTLVNEVLAGSGTFAPGQNASILDPRIDAASKKARDLSIKQFGQSMKELGSIEGIDMNADIAKASARSFDRTVKLMDESNILLAGINEQYKVYEKELAQIFAYITGRTDKGTKYGEGAGGALMSGGVEGLTSYMEEQRRKNFPMSPFTPQASKLDNAYGKISISRKENKPSGIMEY